MRNDAPLESDLPVADDAIVAQIAVGSAVVARHPARDALPVRVAPSVDERHNTLHPRLAVLACWRMGRALFEFDSSFVRPELRESAPRFATQVQSHPDARLSVFGHADPIGDDEYNKLLAGRRAAAVYGLLARDVALWEGLHDHPVGSDSWGVLATQRMLRTLIDPESSGPQPFFPREPDGIPDPRLFAATRVFQRRNGLPETGIADARTRRALYRAYMDAICVDASGAPFAVLPERFVGGGRDPGGKGAYQGCGEFNPIALLSTTEPMSPTDRIARNAPNRRAMVFLFHPGAPDSPETWPCPRVREPSAGCRKMFWPDGDKRRTARPSAREYRKDRMTMACSFYDRLARRSPCEGVAVIPSFRVRLFDTWGQVILRAPFEITGEGFALRGVAETGTAVVRNIRAPATCTVRWARPEEERRRYRDDGAEPLAEFEYELEVFIDLDAAEDDEDAAGRMLDNLGYSDRATLSEKVKAFQIDLGRQPTGVLADILDELEARHAALTPIPHVRPLPPE